MTNIILDNEAVQALANPQHRKHQRTLAYVEATTGRAQRSPTRWQLTIPTAVQVEAGWDRQAGESASLNRLRAARPPLDGDSADRAARLVAALASSVADAQIGDVVAQSEGPHVILTSDVEDMARVAAFTGRPVRIIAI